MVVELSSFGDWELKQKLGTGGFGEVLLWKNRRSGQSVATKRCIRDRNSMHDDEIEKLKQRWLQEFGWMRNVGIKYIVHGLQLHDSAFITYLNSRHGLWRPLPVIVMEYCNGGDLRHELRKVSNSNGLTEFEVRQVMYALRHAVEYLHETCKIEHRDLKPDNIVVHDTGKERIYKLTDFGFCCQVLDQTTQASIVGTSNYIAPEVVTTSQYTKTVDYWSMGVIAFELMCGVLPFIPHQTPLNKIKQLQEKSHECIAIAEDPMNCNKFVFRKHLFAENRLSGAFQLRMENWLRLALDYNFRTRGCIDHRQTSSSSNQNVQIFTALDEILEAKILTVFCLNTCNFYSYDLSTKACMQELINALQQDTQLPPKTYYFILPTGHPHSRLTERTQPVDLYVAEWLNTAPGCGNPPAMLFLLSYQGCYNETMPSISPLIKYILQMNCIEELPRWARQQLAAQTHFLVANEQRHLEALLVGLQEYALTLEHEMFLAEPTTITEVTDKIMTAVGGVGQFSIMVQQAKTVCQKKLSNGCALFHIWDKKVNVFNNRIHTLQNEIRQSLKKRYASAYRRIKEQAKNPYFTNKINADYYDLIKLRAKIENLDFDNLLTLCHEVVYATMERRHEFLNSMELKSIQTEIAAIHLEFSKIQEIVVKAREYVQKLDCDLVQASAEFQEQMMENAFTIAGSQDVQLSRQLNGLTMDCTNINNQSNISNGGGTLSLDDILSLPPTTQLVEETKEHINLFKTMYDDVDDDDENLTTLPTTINMD